ncbi:MAG: DUF1080 domain-containing protein [Saprospiraceae bacterium]|nr:DUF1080 domain-containing protein [Saprospiraceae bacterium]MBP9745944.1 DUF1080 domain-containing protein [Saprospiraceae bacterium]
MKKPSFFFYFSIAFLLFLVVWCSSINAQHETPQPSAIEGRWDLSITSNGKVIPSWLEVNHSGIRTLVGHFVGSGGSARPISQVFVEGAMFHFAIPPQWENTDKDLKVNGRVEADKLSGTMTMPDGNTYPFTGVRAPSLRTVKQPVWGPPITLFNGKDLTGWTALGTNQWIVESGVLKSAKSGANIRTDKTFKDFKLHVEFRYPKGSNSGVYLRGRYEVQIEDSKGSEPWLGGLGALYGFLKPSDMVAKDPGEWQSYDITLIGRRVTVIANGKMIIQNQEIPGITGGALDSNEGEPGPIYFQGDHGAIEFRNIVITPAK